MRYILNDNIRLYSYADHPYSVYDKERGFFYDVPKKTFTRLVACDGKTDAEDADAYEELLQKNLIRPAREGEKLSPDRHWQVYGHDRILFMNLEITERCNYNCRHCFNAEGFRVPRSELSLPEIRHILDEAYEYGIFNVVLTGGEPMIHPDFMEIVRYISKKGMNLSEINTNGSRITKEMLEEFAELGMQPMMKISFDGTGFHNWMRGMDASSSARSIEEETVEAIRLCTAYGFRVFVQMNLNALNKDCIPASLELLDSLGVYRTRIIRTSESPRWLESISADGIGIMSWKEYFDECLKIAEFYLKREYSMSLIMWQFAFLHSRKKLFFAYKIAEDGVREDTPLCSERLDICANGELYPCLQMSGYFKAHGFRLGSIRESSLKELISDSPYQTLVGCTRGDKKRSCKSCGECPFFSCCANSCPALSLLSHGAYLGRDDSACIFFRDGYYQKLKALLPPDFKDMRPLSSCPDPAYLMQLETEKLWTRPYNSTDYRELLSPTE